ncbi:hypothetical protein A2U01_0006529 [Trifolium medium]|uniref:Uncharacterized protein n=1 Tax=Trifolium medium TaxID=97028 RepID=A0A392MDX9_9FABA|nr:hypothetical protein [Trifolium medium]
MVKDAMDLIEDERLELMELAASKKGLSSILALDYETMQNLESYGEYKSHAYNASSSAESARSDS